MPSVPEDDASRGPSATAEDDAYKDRVLGELNRLFIEQSGEFPLAQVLVLPILAYVAALTIPAVTVFAWAVIVAGCLAVRWRVARAMRGDALTLAQLKSRGWILAGAWSVTALAAGLAPLVWFGQMESSQRTIFSIAFFALYAGVAVGALVYRSFSFAFGGFLIGSLAVAWAQSGDVDGRTIGVVCAALFVFVWWAADGARRTIRDANLLKLRQVELVDRLEQHGRELEAAMRSKSHFLASASHDLRQPVTSMNLLLSAMQAARDERSLRSVAAKLEAPLQALEEILSSLLEVSRLEAGIIRVDKYSASMRDIIGVVLDEYRPRAQAKRLRLAASVGEIRVWTDPELLRRVLRNLLDNAIKFTDRGGVSVEAFASGNDVTVAVTDSGKGVVPEIRERIFDDYFQGENPHRDRRQGLGLGLSIVRRLVGMLGGQVRLVPTAPPGARFEVTLPGTVDHSVPGRVPVAVQVRKPSKLRFSRVLVVEDDRLVSDAIGMLFDSLGLETRFARDADEALGLISLGRFMPELTLVDFGLPGSLDGISIIGELRLRLPKCAFLLITGDTRPEVIRRAADQGISVLHKPLSVDRLDAALKEIGLSG